MILPRYSIRTLLIITVVCALISLIIRQAYLGRPWAIGLWVAIGTAACLLVMHVMLFAAAQLFASVRKTLRPPEVGKSPFASAGLPRQVIAPVESE